LISDGSRSSRDAAFEGGSDMNDGSGVSAVDESAQVTNHDIARDSGKSLRRKGVNNTDAEGRTLVTVTPEAVEGPRLVTDMV